MRDPALAELIGNATRRVFIRIIDLCLAEEVDALLIAGDLYDGDQTSMKTARFLSEQLRRLHEAGIRSYIIRGNHDALSKITKELTFPDSVKLFGGRAEAISVERPNGAVPVTIQGLSFANPHAPDSLHTRFKPPVEGAVNIGILHTSLAGAPGHDLYAPCSIADLTATGFHYWALGHIHKRSAIGGTCSIVMPGMPQGRDINEAGPKSVTLVTIAEDHSIRIEERRTSIAEFERVTVDATGIEDWRDLVGSIDKAIETTRRSVTSDHLVARLRLTGTTKLAWRLRNDLDLLKSEADERAAIIGASFIEKLEIDCHAPGATADQRDDPLLELRRLITEDIVPSPAYQAEILKIAEELRGQLPPECRTLLGRDETELQEILNSLVRDGSDDVLARLRSGTASVAV